MIYILPLPNLLEHVSADVLVPAYSGESAGLDLYNAGPDIEIQPILTKGWADSLELLKQNNYLFDELPENVRKIVYKTLMPTGIKVQIPVGYVGLITERGSVVKTPLKVRAGVIDPGYKGEVFVNCINLCDRPFIIKAGEKTPFQLLVIKCDNQFSICDEDAYLQATTDSKRQGGQIGSSDIVVAQNIHTVNM